MVFQVNHKLTLQEFLNLPPGEGDITYELVDGQAIPKMSPKKFHSKLTRALLNLIEKWFVGCCYALSIFDLRLHSQGWRNAPRYLNCLCIIDTE